MRKLKLLILLYLLNVLAVQAQQNKADSLHNDSVHLNEQVLLQQQQAQKVDSLIKNKLEKEIDALAEDSKKRVELEKQLEQIAINDSIRKAEQKSKIALLQKTAVGYPVTLLNDTLFNVYTRLGSFSAADRAAAINARLEKLYKNDFYNADTLKLVRGENTYDILYNNDMIVMSVSELDALYFNSTPQQLAQEYLQLIKKTLHDTRKANSLVNWGKRLGLVALVIIGIGLVIYIINRLFKAISKRIIAYRNRLFKGIHIKSFRLFTPRQHLVFFLRVITVLRIFTILLALYLSLPLLFSIFPATEAYTYTLLNWIITPAKSIISGIIDYMPKLFTILVIYLFTLYTIKGIRYVAHEVETGTMHLKGFYSDWARPTFNIIRFLLYAFMVIIIFPYLPGSGSPAFQGVSVFLGILFSLGSSSAIANVVAGLVITYMRPFKVGDRVKIGDITGDVLEKTMLVTRLKTIKNEEITVPNASVLSSYTINYTSCSQHPGLIIHTTVTIGYDVPWKKMHQALIEAALQTELILKDPAPFVLQTGLEDFYVSYQINAYTQNPFSQAKIYSDLHQHIQDCCIEAGIEILSPHYRAMRDGNNSTLPDDHLPREAAASKTAAQQKTTKKDAV